MHQEGEFRESNYPPPTAPHQFGPQASSSDHGGPAFRMARPPPPGFPNMPYPVRYPPSYRSSAPQQFQCFPRPSGVDAQIPHAQAHVHGTDPIASGGPPQPEVMPSVVAIDIDTPPPGTSIGVGGEMGISTESPEEGTAVNPQENKDKLQSTHVKPDPIISHVADQASDQHMPGHVSTDQASPRTPDQASPRTPDQASPRTPDQASSDQASDKASSDQASCDQAPDKASSDQVLDEASSDQDQASDKATSHQPSSDQTPDKASSLKVKKYFFKFSYILCTLRQKGTCLL